MVNCSCHPVALLVRRYLWQTFGEVFLRAFSTETFYRLTRGGTGATFSICKSKVINQLTWVHKASSSPKTDLLRKQDVRKTVATSALENYETSPQ